MNPKTPKGAHLIISSTILYIASTHTCKALIKIEFFLFSKLPIPKPRKIAKTTTGRREPCDNDLNIFAGMIPSKKSFKLVLLVRPFNDVFC